MKHVASNSKYRFEFAHKSTADSNVNEKARHNQITEHSIRPNTCFYNLQLKLNCKDINEMEFYRSIVFGCIIYNFKSKIL